MTRPAVIFFLVIFSACLALAAERKPVTPSDRDKCPVCGMFVKKYPDWTSQLLFKDGSYALFDGAKDMFKYYLGMKSYNPSHTPADVASMYVMDYYSMRLVDGSTALYVIGSDVYGPMGRELIPFITAEEAKEFMKDHKGRAVLTFKDVTPDVLKGLD